jgi:hypothetical protein
MVDFFTTRGVEYWKMSSRNELVTAGRSIYDLAEPGRQYLVYAAIRGKLFDKPRRGQLCGQEVRSKHETGLGTRAGGESRTFTVSDAHDWVLYLIWDCARK